MVMKTLDFIYQCIDCGKEIQSDKIVYLCPDCSKENKPGLPPKGVMKILYNYDIIREDFKGSDIFYDLKSENYLDLLPINSIDSLPGLKIGNTPLYEVDQFEGKPLNAYLYLKDDSRNPTFSLKDRASAVVSAYAKEKGLKKIVAASTGNAGSSMAGICAAQDQEAIVLVPETAPKAKLAQVMMYGATIVPVAGSYDDAFDLSIKLTEETGIFNRNTAYNPLTIEGKKTVAFEIYDQLSGDLPDHVFIPTGDGVIISGVYKGFEDLLKLGVIKKMPIMVAVQAAGSNNLIRNINNPEFKIVKSKTIADSISVDIPRNFYMAAQYMKKYNGIGISVNDSEIMEASQKLARQTGIFSEPSSAAAFAGFIKMKKAGKIQEASSNLVLLTGSGLKDIQAVEPIVKIPKSIACNIKSIKKLLNF
ncbi:MAG: threonine synthase [Bacteroidetes bacterium 4484_276]|nr:MAG: threonine synthase [Bacteroidetes bacterium 4484_276]